MRYELWISNDGEELTFFSVDNTTVKDLLSIDSYLDWFCEADSHDDAMTQYHKYMGWEEYKPF